MKLKDYDGGDLEQYSLKNFDLRTFQLAQTEPDPDPIPGPPAPAPLTQEADSPSPLPAAWTLEQPTLAPCDVQFGAHFNLQTVTYNPLASSQPWKIPRWVVVMVGLFFGSAAVLMIASCVVLLRDPKPAPTAQPTVPTAPVATTSAAPVATTSAAPARSASSASTPAAVPTHVVSRHPSVVRRQVYGPRRVPSKRASSSVAPQETETASRRPAKDALDQLLSESSL